MRNQSLNKVLGWVGPARGNKDEAPSNSESVRVRRSTRVPLAVSVTISSSDQSGPGFKENTGTIDVSKHGARILTLRALKPGTTLEIAKPAAGKTYLAKVLWQSRKRGPKEPIETGIEILEAFDAKGFWGVTSPPDDWKNSVAGDAFRPLDVYPSRKGLNVEIGNTDAEGRLVLADALALADEETPDLLVDMGTLTGAARVALGPELPPYFTDDETLAAEVARHAAAENDPLWRLPLWQRYDQNIDSKVADVNNVAAGGMAGSIICALFLKRFVSAAKSWLHFDIYAWTPSPKPGRPEGGECQAARALYALLKQRYGR